MKYLVVIDVQNDFVDGALGSPEAQNVIEKIKEKIDSFDGEIVYTRDTHKENYLETQEGRMLPVIHCVEGTKGWQISDEIEVKGRIFNKPTFGSIELAQYLKENKAESVELIGLDTDICVISNAMTIKAFMPEVPIFVDADCCAGTSEENHKKALDVMKICQVTVKGE